MADLKQLSREAYERLSSELADLTTRGRIDIARKIETARELGDLSENGDYHAAKEEQGKMEGRIMHLQALLEDVEVVDAIAATDEVANGNIVTIRYEGDTDTERYLVGSIEERREGITVMSPGSPLGAALLGAKVGETVKYEAPGGQLAVEIVRDRSLMATPRTLSQKVWDSHVVKDDGDGSVLLYIDLHLVHEVTSPQAFEGLRLSGRTVRRPDLTVATEDHNVPTTDQSVPIADPISKKQLDVLRANTAEFGITNYPMGHPNQGIVHVIGPELGLTQPGMTVVCGDSHTSTHGAFGALAFGIGTSEVEHVLATQTLPQLPQETMAVTINGELPAGSSAKDVVLAVLARTGTSGGIGAIAEYRGPVIEALSMEGRMTVCNMSIEWGAKAGLIAPDDITFAYLEGRSHAPSGADWDAAVEAWRGLGTDDGAVFDREIVLDGADCVPHITWGTNPGQVAPIASSVPDPDSFAEAGDRDAAARALEYMGLTSGTPLRDIAIDTVFIGSCTNSRIEDLRAAAAVAKGRTVKPGVRTLVVPGSGMVKQQAIAEGLDRVFIDAGFDWREPGCSMCLAMNPDKLSPGERCASTSNRNFEGRQGRGGRTHLVSPEVAVATAIAGHVATPEDLP